MKKHIITLNINNINAKYIKNNNCCECKTSCQSACKTSCTIGNQICKKYYK